MKNILILFLLFSNAIYAVDLCSIEGASSTMTLLRTEITIHNELSIINNQNKVVGVLPAQYIDLKSILGGSDDTAQAKKKIMADCGIHVVDSPAEIGKKVKEVVS